MERIMKIGTVFIIVTLACLLAIITADGNLTWGTGGLVLLILFIIGLVVGVWTVVHGSFTTPVEIGLTIGIVILGLLILALAAMAGREMLDALEDLVTSATVLWLVWPLVATGVLSMVLGLHKRPRRTTARRP